MKRRPLPCPLCGGRAFPFSLDISRSIIGYRRCGQCGFVGMEKSDYISRKEERARYLLHDNSASNSGYMEYLRSFIDRALFPFKSPGARILDFGSGPSPCLAELAAGLGYECDIYDPLFAPTRSWKHRSYDAVLLHEVAEHLKNPGKVLTALADRVAGGGILAIRTRFLPEEPEDFETWWYRMDRTHVSFFPAAGLAKFFETRGFMILLLEKPDILVIESPRYKDVR